jgi:hypothetical protein
MNVDSSHAEKVGACARERYRDDATELSGARVMLRAREPRCEANISYPLRLLPEPA